MKQQLRGWGGIHCGGHARLPSCRFWFQSLIAAPAVIPEWLEVQHLAAVADPALARRERSSLLPLSPTCMEHSCAQATSGAQPRWRVMSSVQP